MAGIKVGSALAPAKMKVDEQVPLYILLVGNFHGSGQPKRSTPIEVDRDNIYELPAELQVRLEGILASSAGATQSIDFEEFDDFQPDALVEKLELFEQFRTLRRRLKNPKHFDSAAAEVLAWGDNATEASSEVPVSPAAPGSEDLFADVLAQSVDVDRSPLESGNWQAFIQKVLADSKIERVDPREDDLVALVDQAIAETMRGVLRSRSFRQLETTWLGLKWLTFYVETHAKLKIFVLDISTESFQSQLDAADWSVTALAQQITRPWQTPGATPWGLIGCLFPWSSNQDDLIRLSRFGDICQEAGAALAVELQGSEADWLSTEEAKQETWNRNRLTRPMQSIAGLWPRVQWRLPYGKKTKPVESFAFEEVPPTGQADLVWGSPVWLALAAIAQGYHEFGWKLDTSAVSQFTDLPLYFNPNGDGDAHPCGEYLLTDSQIEHLMQIGLSPIVSFKNQDRVQLRGIQSLAGGRWLGPWSSP
ncbi:type VI secretion system contractile sheath domain-containing protein [Bremerella cremea]|uniref:type VI secretion system contractile sheath domain-containing protein n=1 Tax=Bremerella cremea TaxID=1031537 RepID=UPI0031EF07B1